MTTENQNPEEPVEDLPLPNFFTGGINVVPNTVTIINPAYKTNDEITKDN